MIHASQRERHEVDCKKCEDKPGKMSRCDWFDTTRPFLLSLENPDDPTHDVARNSYNFARIRRAFEFGSQVRHSDILLVAQISDPGAAARVDGNPRVR